MDNHIGLMVEIEIPPNRVLARNAVLVLLCAILVYSACSVTQGSVSLLLGFLALAAFPAGFWSKFKFAVIAGMTVWLGDLLSMLIFGRLG